MPDDKQQLDVSDLDDEDLKALAEVSRKGYYHARPKNESAPEAVPQRLDVAPPEATATGKRAELDDFQRKWDKFDHEDADDCLTTTGGRARANPAAQRASSAASATPALPPASQPPSPGPLVADEDVVRQLTGMGFDVDQSRAAAAASRNRVDVAVELLFSGKLGQGVGSGAQSAQSQPDPEKVTLLMEMGFAEDLVREALAACNNDVERAVERAASPPAVADRSTPRPAADMPAEKLRRAREQLNQTETDVAALEAASRRCSEDAASAKLLRSCEEIVTEVCCSLDSVSVVGGVELREERRVELKRCSALEERLAALRGGGQRQPDEAPAGGSATVAGPPPAPASEEPHSPAGQRIAEAERLRLEGNAAFKDGAFDKASMHYKDALEMDADNVAILSNLAAAELKLCDYEAAAIHAAAANELSGGFSAKAFFRQGQALEGLGRCEEAAAAYNAALEVEPGDRTVRQRLEACKKASGAAPAG